MFFFIYFYTCFLLPICHFVSSTPPFRWIWMLLKETEEAGWQKPRRRLGFWGSLLMTLISHFYDSYITGNKKALICNWIPPRARRRAHAHAHTHARKHILCNLAYCNTKTETYYGFPSYIHTFSQPSQAGWWEACSSPCIRSTLLYNNQCARKVFLHDPGEAQKNVGEEESRVIFDD